MPTKKDYLAISTILRNNRPNTGRTSMRYKTWWRIREDLITYFYKENGSFDCHLFREHTEFNKDWAQVLQDRKRGEDK